MRDVIVGVDRSETAHRAAVTAAELAAAYGVNLHLVMCVERGKTVEVTVGSERLRTDWVGEAGQFLAALAASLPHDSITHAVHMGDPASTICEEAERLDARTIVVGNRRVQGASRILGAVATDIARNACCDVLIANTR
jgi:nucleotide-binding universal stress UspA family protein